MTSKKRKLPRNNGKQIKRLPLEIVTQALADVGDRLGWKHHVLYCAPDNTRMNLRLVRSYAVDELSNLNLSSGEPDLTIDWGSKLITINPRGTKIDEDFLRALRQEIRKGGLFVQPTDEEIIEDNLYLLQDWQFAAGLLREGSHFEKREWLLNISTKRFALLVPLFDGDLSEEGIFAIHPVIETQGDHLQIGLRDIDEVGIGLMDGVDLADGQMLLRMGLQLEIGNTKNIDPELKRFVEWFEKWLGDHKLIRNERPVEAVKSRGGRPRNEDDEWAYQEVRINQRKPDVIYAEWLDRIGERASLLADPRDSFSKAIRKRRKN